MPYLVVATLIMALGVAEGPEPTYHVAVSWLTVYLSNVLAPAGLHWKLIKLELPDQIVVAPLIVGMMALGASLNIARMAGVS